MLSILNSIERFKTKIIYFRDDFCTFCGIIPTINYIFNNNMENTLKVIKFLKLLVGIPMISSEAEISFSTLKRIKTCSRSVVHEKKLNALIMLSLKSCMINECDSFNQKVIDEFCKIKERRMDFVCLYKVDV